MSLYITRPRKGAYGYAIGILTPDDPGTFVRGDVANAESYDFPVIYRAVPGLARSSAAPVSRMLEDAVVEAAHDLEAQGVRAIAGASSQLIRFQRLVARAVRIPVLLSSLLQLQLVGHILPRNRAIGIVASNAQTACDQIGELSLNHGNRRMVVTEMVQEARLGLLMNQEGVPWDERRVCEYIEGLSRQMLLENDDMGAIVLESSTMSKYSHVFHRMTGLPVFDCMTMIRYLKDGVRQKQYSGYY